MSEITARQLPPPVESLITIAEAGRRLRLSRTTVYVLMSTGRLAYVKIRKARRIPLASVAELIRSSTHAGRQAFARGGE